MEKFDKRILKKKGEMLEGYLAFKKRGSAIRCKKGKGSYRRKHKYVKEMTNE